MIRMSRAEYAKRTGQNPPKRQPRTAPTGLTVTLFQSLCVQRGLAVPVPEFQFDPWREWRLDWAWPNPEHLLALEIQGGIWTRGRHVRGAALLKEWEKLNAAAEIGFRLLFCSPDQFASGAILDVVERCLR